MPNTAFERQILPFAYNREHDIGSLYQISGRDAVIRSFRADKELSEILAFLQSGLQECKKAGMPD